MPLVAVFGTIGFQKKPEGAMGSDATAKVPGGPSRSSQNINDGKNKSVAALAIAKEPDRLSEDPARTFRNYGTRSKSSGDGNNNGA